MSISILHRLLCQLVFLIFCTGAFSTLQAADSILKKYHEFTLLTISEEDVGRVKEWVATMPADGWWPDVPKSNGTKREYKAHKHVRRLAVIAALSGKDGAFARRATTV